MRYRALTSTNDFSLGLGPSEFLVDSPACVAQAVLTALLLYQNSWFLDSTVGTPWFSQIIGYGTQSLYDTAIKSAILNVEGVQSIASYSSSLSSARALTVNANIITVYGAATITTTLGGGG